MPNLIPGYIYRHMDAEETASYLSAHRFLVFADTVHLGAHYAHSEAEQHIALLAERVSERYSI